MKKFMILSLFVLGLGCFAAEFDRATYNDLMTTYRESKKSTDLKKVDDYILASTKNGVAADDYIVLVKQIPAEFIAAKKVPTAAELKAKVDEKFTAFDESGTVKDKLLFGFYIRYKHLNEAIAMAEVAPVEVQNGYFLNCANLASRLRNYDKAFELAAKCENADNVLFNVYKAQKNNAKVWSTGKDLFLNQYVSNARSALSNIKTMFMMKPDTITDAEVSEFLKKLADKYPTPGTDFDTWKGFMGFIGYKYKSITGKDLFATEAAAPAATAEVAK